MKPRTVNSGHSTVAGADISMSLSAVVTLEGLLCDNVAQVDYLIF